MGTPHWPLGGRKTSDNASSIQHLMMANSRTNIARVSITEGYTKHRIERVVQKQLVQSDEADQVIDPGAFSRKQVDHNHPRKSDQVSCHEHSRSEYSGATGGESLDKWPFFDEGA